MELTREMRRKALEPFRNECDYDDWGVTLGHWFGVAETLYHAGEDLPAKWQFQHGMSQHDLIGSYHGWDTPCPNAYSDVNCGTDEYPSYDCACGEERYYVPFLDAGETGIAMLRYAGNVIDRYAGWLKRAGKDY